MKLTGGCHCGAIRYSAEAQSTDVVLCHCTDCQQLSGSPYRASVGVAAEAFVIDRGAPKVYVKIADSGNRRAQAFCGDCGSHIYASEAERPTRFNLRLGSIDQRAECAPALQIWQQSALDWTADLTNIPAKPRDP